MIEVKYKKDVLSIDVARGANVKCWKRNGADLFHVDSKSYSSSNIKYKGGNPIMFPIFSTSKMDGSGSVCYNGRRIFLPQHGLARISPAWKALQQDEHSVDLFLQHQEEFIEMFPFPFELQVRYALTESGLLLIQKVTNPGKEKLPFVVGFHPYFKVSNPIHCEINGIPWGTTYHYQPNQGEHKFNEKYLTPLPLGEKEVNHHFRFPHPHVRLHDRVQRRTFHLIKSTDYKDISIWSEPGEPFVCVEPNTARRGALETREDLLVLNPGEQWQGQIEIRVE